MTLDFSRSLPLQKLLPNGHGLIGYRHPEFILVRQIDIVWCIFIIKAYDSMNELQHPLRVCDTHRFIAGILGRVERSISPNHPPMVKYFGDVVDKVSGPRDPIHDFCCS